VTQTVVVAGAGYVGLTTAACLASLGHRVICGDLDASKTARLRTGAVDILEPRLAELLSEGLTCGQLEFVCGIGAAVARAGQALGVVILCVPTPSGASGAVDLSAVDSVVTEIRELLPSGSVLVIKSTVPVGTATRLRAVIDREDVAVVSNPEFLREGTAVPDFLGPERIVVGSDSADAAALVAGLYTRLGAPTVLTDATTAELVKYAANRFLAVKLSYINGIAELCERFGADITDITDALGYDHRIGREYLRPGPGWGGPCLPKDVRALAGLAGAELPLLQAALDINARRQDRIVAQIRAMAGGRLSGQRIALLGLAFKAGTNDLRDSPAAAVAEDLCAQGAEVVAFDPGLTATAATPAAWTLANDPYRAVSDAAVLVLLTQCPQFRALDWQRVAELMAGSTVLDTCNHLDPEALRSAGLHWRGFGKPADPCRTNDRVPTARLATAKDIRAVNDSPVGF
jgi:UDPglucose 6-dehydrogenase